MNCKPGDLAIRVRAYVGSVIPVGAVVKCLKFDPGVVGLMPSWAGSNVEFATKVSGAWIVEWRSDESAKHPLLCIPDEHLRPIRDPGDDAVDEMVHLLGAPQCDEVLL